MERRKYRTYTQEFKEAALRLLASSGRSASELERELGITPGTLLKWRKRESMCDARRPAYMRTIAPIDGHSFRKYCRYQ